MQGQTLSLHEIESETHDILILGKNTSLPNLFHSKIEFLNPAINEKKKSASASNIFATSKPPLHSSARKGSSRATTNISSSSPNLRRGILAINKAQSYNGSTAKQDEVEFLARPHSSPGVYHGEDKSNEEPPADNPELMLRVLTLKGVFSASITSRPDKALNTAQRWAHAAQLFMEQKEYEKAVTCERYNIKIRQKVLGSDHPQTATSIAKYASYKMALGDFKAAYKHFSRAHKILKSVKTEAVHHDGVAMGPAAYLNGMYDVALDHYTSDGLDGKVEQAVLTNNLGAIFLALWNHPKADKSLQIALEDHLSNHSKNSEMRGAILLNTGNLCFSKGAIEDALVHLQGAKSAFEKAFGEKHHSVATCLNNIGAVLLKKGGSLIEAEENITAGFEMRIELLGDKHPATANSYANLGMLKKRMREYVAAAEFYRKSLDIRRKHLGNNHPDVAVSYNNLAVLCKTVGDTDNALRFYHKALDIKKSALGENHILLAGVHCNLGNLYRKQKRNIEAVNHFNSALAIRKRTFGKVHELVAKVMRQIAQLLRDQKENQQALSLLEEALAILKQCPETVHTQLQAAMMLSELGATLYIENRCEEAARRFKESVDIRIKYTSQFTSDVAVTYMNMGFALTKGKFYSQAAECFKNAAQIRAMILGKDHPDTTESELQAAAVRTAIESSGKSGTPNSRKSKDNCYQM